MNETSNTIVNSIEAVANISCVLYNLLGTLEQYHGNRRAFLLQIHCSIITEDSWREIPWYSSTVPNKMMPNLPSIANFFQIEIMRTKVKMAKQKEFQLRHLTWDFLFVDSAFGVRVIVVTTLV